MVNTASALNIRSSSLPSVVCGTPYLKVLAVRLGPGTSPGQGPRTWGQEDITDVTLTSAVNGTVNFKYKIYTPLRVLHDNWH